MNKIKKWAVNLKLNIKFTILTVAFVLIPIIALSAWLFRSMEQNVIGERKNAMDYRMTRSYDQILKNVDSINMSTQFFLSDTKLKDYLASLYNGDSYSTQEKMEFYNEDIASLERMVNNNPYLYQIRVYTDNEMMKEMMPILYNYSRMNRLDWADDECITGWKYNYADAIFDSFSLNQNKKYMSLITPVEVYSLGQIALVEVSMEMETMFAPLYETDDKTWSCFVADDGTFYFGNAEPTEERNTFMERIMKHFEVDTEGDLVYYKRYEGKHLVVGYQPMKEVGGILISVNDISEDIQSIYNQRTWFILIAVCLLFLLALCINAVVKGLLKKFYEILGSIREVQRGDLDVVIENCGTDEMGELGNQINKMLTNIKRLTNDNLKHELLVKNTEIRALQNQINAHFIYNVLESIKMMAEIDEKYEISDAITTLGKLLRYSMRWTGGNVTVEEELEYIRNYLSLINLRFDYEIYLSENIPERIYKQEIPKMSLQPIVENAIYHGIEQMAEDTNIYVKGIVDGKDCIIEITDAGKGMSEEEVANLYRKITGEVEASGGSGNGIGLKNVQDRIKMNFGERYGISISSKLGCYTKIQVRIPMQIKSKGDR